MAALVTAYRRPTTFSPAASPNSWYESYTVAGTGASMVIVQVPAPADLAVLATMRASQY